VKLLVTGIGGFVGSHVARVAVRRSWEVHGLVRSQRGIERLGDIRAKITLHEGDLAAPGTDAKIRSLDFDACIHAAWFAEPSLCLDSLENLNSLQGTLRLARALCDGGCRRLVGVGTCFEYGFNSRPARESDPPAPRNLYAASKVAAGDILRSVGATTRMEVVWARLFSVYGPLEDPRRLVAYVVDSLLSEKPAKLTLGKAVRDYLHVEDAARALADLVAGNQVGLVNVSSGVPTTVRNVAETIGEIVGRPDLLEFGALPENPKDPPCVCADISKLAGTGWSPRYSLKTGLEDTVKRHRAIQPVALRP
jgi:nucleoside-diphosphate-sugar epimerase